MTREQHQYTTNDYILPTEVIRIVQAMNLPGVSSHPERDSLLIEVGWETGGRVSEVLTLVPEHVLETSVIMVNLKQKPKPGKKVPTKVVEVSDVLCDWLRRYCEANNILPRQWIFPAITNPSEHLSRGQVHKIITRASEAAHVFRFGKAHPKTGGRSKGVSYHILRHSYATFLLKQTNNLALVQHQLGHASVTSTQRYANVAYDDVRGKVAAAGVNLYHH